MGSKENTIFLLRATSLGNCIELLDTAYLPMLPLSAKYLLKRQSRHFLHFEGRRHTSNGELVSWFVAATTRLKSSFLRIAAPKTLFPLATPIAVRGMIPCSIVCKNAEISWEGE
jgi:hypothetical protein